MKKICYRKYLSVISLIFALSACGGGESESSTNTTEKQTTLDLRFSSLFVQKIESDDDLSQKENTLQRMSAIPMEQDLRFTGELETTNVTTGEKQNLNWLVTLRTDGTIDSHNTITLKPGFYDFRLVLERNNIQYVAQALAQEITSNANDSIELKLLPNLGDTISDIKDVKYLTTIRFEYPTSDFADIVEPRFGMSLNRGDEYIFDINKDEGVTEITISKEAGEHTLDLRLYESDLLVANNEHSNTINFAEGENVAVDLISLQSDIDFNIDRLNQNGDFVFNIPKVVIDEVGGAQYVALLVRMTAGDNPMQEKILDVVDNNGIFQASKNFDTYGEDILTTYLGFYNASEVGDGFNGVPYASCSTTINVENNQVLGCKLELKRNNVVSGRLLGTLMLNVADKDGVPAAGAEVYLNDKLVGVTGNVYQNGSFKTHQVAGDYTLRAIKAEAKHESDFSLAALDVLNKSIKLAVDDSDKEFHFVKSDQQIDSGWANGRRIIADFNNNGHLDIFETRTNDITDILWLNDGKGYFTSYTEIQREGNQYSNASAAGDLNGDGYLDLVVGGANQRPLTVYTNDGKGNFTKFHEINTNGVAIVELADLNGSGYLDLVTFSDSQEGKFSVYLNDGSSRFNSSPDSILTNHECTYQLDGDSVRSSISDMQLADLNNDGNYDLVFSCTARTYNGVLLPTKNSGFYYGNSEGSFTLSETSFPNAGGATLAVGDLNGSGYKDIILGSFDNIELVSKVFWNNGKDGTFSEFELPVMSNGKRALSMQLADIDKDGSLEIVSKQYNDGYYGFYKFNQDRELVKQGQLTIPSTDRAHSFYMADFDGNGRPDIFEEVHGLRAPSNLYFNMLVN